MSGLTRICAVFLLGLSIVPIASAVELDSFTQVQVADTWTDFASGLGGTTRTLALLGPSAIEIDGMQLSVSGSAGGVPLLAYDFDVPTDFTAYGSIVLAVTAQSGNPTVQLDLFDGGNNLQSGSFSEVGGSYVAYFADFDQIDFSAIITVGLRFADTGASYSLASSSLSVVTVPEPGTWALMAAGGLALFVLRRKKRCGAPVKGVSF